VTAGWTSYLRILECTACGAEFDPDVVHSVCPTCHKVLFARYDLPALNEAMTPGDFRGRRWDMWRYSELLPVRDPANVVTLGEGMTPSRPGPCSRSAWIRPWTCQRQGRGEEPDREL
jgi:threonine synthase